MFDISKKTHKTESNKRITYWFVLIKTKGSIKMAKRRKKAKKGKKKAKKRRRR